MKNYIRLKEIGRNCTNNLNNLPEIKMALLGDHSTQQLSLVLRGVLIELGYFPHLYEASYDTGIFETLDLKGPLYLFKPHYIYYSNSVQKFRERFYNCKPTARESLPSEYVDHLKSMIESMISQGVQVIINTLPLPVERMFGNFSVQTNQSFYGAVIKVNELIKKMVNSYSGCYINDLMYLSAQVGANNFFDEKLWVLSRYFCSNIFLPQIANNIANIIGATRGKLTKCIILDLDNTLWGGVIGDDGIEGIVLNDSGPGEAFQQFQKYILSLKQRGYLLAVCSKNEEAAAKLPFKSHPCMVLSEDDISVFVANWNNKASNIEYIAKTLNLSLDSFVFLDDNKFERDLVLFRLPQVKVPALPEEVCDWPKFIEEMNLFETVTFSEEDAERSSRYKEDALRAQQQLMFGDIDEYLKSLEMKIFCKVFNSLNLERVAQLIQRSNQFNLRTQRFSKMQCEEMMKNPDSFLSLTFSLEDKIGNYGLIAVVCCSYESEYLNILEFVMSCRVLKRGVEQFVIETLIQKAKEKGYTKIRGEYIYSPKNAMVKDFLFQCGFEKGSYDSKSEVQEYWYNVLNFQKGKTLFSEVFYE